MSTDLISTEPTLIVRTARKHWRCICADPIKYIEVAHHCEHGVSFSRAHSDAEVEAIKERQSGKTCHGGKRPQREWWEVARVPNPNYRGECLGDIEPGEIYVEYVGESLFYQHGSSYCRRCAVAVWDEVSEGVPA
jgi:hypothetical protein